MKRKLTQIEKSFDKFLHMVNLVGPRPLPDVQTAISDRVSGLNDTASENDLDKIKREELKRAIETVLDSPAKATMFTRLLFAAPSVDDLKAPIFGQARDTSEITTFEAPGLYNWFRSNHRYFFEIIDTFDSLASYGGPRNVSVSSLITSLPTYLTVELRDDQRIVKVEVQEHALFDGFRDFNRVRKCPVCSKFFLALRTDAKYCSDVCGSDFRQKTLRQKRTSKKNKTEGHK